MTQKRQRRKPMSEINVVPYIDVMLVLLVIFMVTAPLIQEGVEVDLPKASSTPIEVEENNEEQIVITVTRSGKLFVDNDGTDALPLSPVAMSNKVAEMLENRTDKRVFVRGDAAVEYGRIVETMAAIQSAGASSIGLVSEPASETDKK